MVLVALRHHVERQLVFLAARADAGLTSISRKQYQQNVTNQREQLKQRGGWKTLEATLNLGSFTQWGKSMKALELLANCFKHEPWQEPEEKLLKHLGLPTVKQLKLPIVRYMPLPESSCFKEGLAAYVKQPKDADYCEIAEKFVDVADQFLEDVHRSTRQARISGRVSLVEFGC